MNFFWFGDSWVYGDELDKSVVGKDLNNHTFAGIVSQHYGAVCINSGECGSSIDDLPYQFYRALDKMQPGDTAFVCLTANHRVSFFDNSGVLRRLLPTEMMGPGAKHRPHPSGSYWFKYFDSPMQRIYNQDRVCNLLYLWCQSLHIKCYFANIFTLQSENLMDIVPTDNWLINRDSCLASCILPLIDKEQLYLDDSPELTNEQWQTQKDYVQKYIRPHDVHPNIEGHKKIASFIIECLDCRQ